VANNLDAVLGTVVCRGVGPTGYTLRLSAEEGVEREHRQAALR
jgi:hypothetical protein